MKIGIITFQETNNYGASLQNYALQQAILHMGHSVDTIDYRSSYIGKPYRLAHLKNKGLFSYLFGVMGYLIYLPRTGKCRRFRQKISYSRPVNRETIGALNQEYDVFITGSDQVWNYKLTGMDPVYLLGFVEDKAKCSSYAASVGISELEPAAEEQYRGLLKGFHMITVRESSSVPLLKSILQRDVFPAADPCLLLTAEEWKQAAVMPKGKGRYVFVYQLGFSADIVKLARRIAEENRLKLVFTPFPVGAFAWGKWDMRAGSAELAGYIKEAEYIVTDSFHGTLLSLIFQKKFFTKIAGTHAGVGSRIYDLLEHYEITDRIVSENIDYKASMPYDRIAEKLSQDRERSLALLDKILTRR